VGGQALLDLDRQLVAEQLGIENGESQDALLRAVRVLWLHCREVRHGVGQTKTCHSLTHWLTDVGGVEASALRVEDVVALRTFTIEVAP
jgi:hypothetical protein